MTTPTTHDLILSDQATPEDRHLWSSGVAVGEGLETGDGPSASPGALACPTAPTPQQLADLLRALLARGRALEE